MTQPTPERPTVFIEHNGQRLDITNMQVCIEDGGPGTQTRLARSVAAEYLKAISKKG